MFGRDYAGVESYGDEILHTREEIVDYVAQMIEDGILDEDRSLIDCKNKKDRRDSSYDQEDKTHRHSMARAYLDHAHNHTSEYTRSENLMYLCGKYIGLDK